MATNNSWNSEDPVQVAKGGTGVATSTAYTVICSGTTDTGSFQTVSGLGVSGQVLISAGAGALPAWGDGGSGQVATVVSQVFTGSGTYTPTSGMRYCIVEVVGAGGGGGGVGDGNTNAFCAGGGGGGGAYGRKVFSSADIGASQTVTIGAAGTAGTAAGAAGTGGTGGTGGNTTLGALLTGLGGAGGVGDGESGPASTFQGGAGGAGGNGSGGDNNVTGGTGAYGWGHLEGIAYSGVGGDSFFGYGGASVVVTGSSGQSAGKVGQGYGSGGSGGATTGSGSSGQTGGAGSGGICVITEYVN